MNKEYFIDTIKSRICTEGTRSIDSIIELVNEFFDSNVCIPKGKHRHKDADVLHEAIEGTNIQELQCNEWCDVLVQDDSNSLSKYRIKPSEPVYEWQWALVLNTIGEIGRTPFMTQQEFDKNVPPEQGIYWTLDIKTKRVRA